MERFQAGDHLTVPLASSRIGTHHGIYVGDGKVIHFTGFDAKTARLVEQTLEEFSLGRRISVVSYASKRCQANSVVVRTARKYLQQADTYPPYDVLDNNCEHFATMCKTGRRESAQASLLEGVVDLASTAYCGKDNTDGAKAVAYVAKKALSFFMNNSS